MLRSFSGNFAHEAIYSDGEIYYNIRYHSSRCEDAAIRGWRAMLSNCKARALDHLLLRGDILTALNRVMLFPGLQSGFQLGNINKHLATHYDEQIIAYLNHIHRIWDLVLTHGGNLDQGDVDDTSVQILQFLAPSISSTDKTLIRSTMSLGQLFPTIVDAGARQRLLTALVSLPGVIPSLETFHENMKYITIGAKILKTHLDIQPKRATASVRSSTLYQRLTSQWSNRCQALVEVSEGYFQSLQGPPSPELAFKQLFVSVLRQFPFLSTEAALRDFRTEVMPAYTDQFRLRRLLRRAKILGYDNPKIREGLDRAEGHIDLVKTPFEAKLKGPIANWRGGKPYVRTLLTLEQVSFLPTIEQVCDALDEESAIKIVQNDIVTAFFGRCKYRINESKFGVSILKGDLSSEAEQHPFDETMSWEGPPSPLEQRKADDVRPTKPRRSQTTRPGVSKRNATLGKRVGTRGAQRRQQQRILESMNPTSGYTRGPEGGALAFTEAPSTPLIRSAEEAEAARSALRMSKYTMNPTSSDFQTLADPNNLQEIERAQDLKVSEANMIADNADYMMLPGPLVSVERDAARSILNEPSMAEGPLSSYSQALVSFGRQEAAEDSPPFETIVSGSISDLDLHENVEVTRSGRTSPSLEPSGRTEAARSALMIPNAFEDDVLEDSQALTTFRVQEIVDDDPDLRTIQPVLGTALAPQQMTTSSAAIEQTEHTLRAFEGEEDSRSILLPSNSVELEILPFSSQTPHTTKDQEDNEIQRVSQSSFFNPTTVFAANEETPDNKSTSSVSIEGPLHMNANIGSEETVQPLASYPTRDPLLPDLV